MGLFTILESYLSIPITELGSSLHLSITTLENHSINSSCISKIVIIFMEINLIKNIYTTIQTISAIKNGTLKECL